MGTVHQGSLDMSERDGKYYQNYYTKYQAAQ